MSYDDHDQEFADFFREHDRRLRGFLAKAAGAPPDIVDEAATKAFLAVRRHWERLRDQAPKQYLFRAGRRKAEELMDTVRYRAELATTAGWDELDQIEGGAHSQIDGLIDQLALNEAVHQLPSSLRQAVMLRYVLGLSIVETAAVMGVEIGTAKRYTFDGLRRLRGILARQTDTGEVEDR